MLYVPLSAGIAAAGRVSARGVLLVLATTFFFIARESLVQLARVRRRETGDDNPLHFLILYLGLAAVFSAPLVALYHLYWIVPAGAAAAVLMGFNARAAASVAGRTLPWEIAAIFGVTLGAPAAYYTTTGSTDVTILWLWILSSLYFISSAFYVRLRVLNVNSRKKEERGEVWRQCALYHSLLLAALVAFAFTRSLSVLVLIAFAPALLRSFWTLARPDRRIDLKRIGVTEIIYSLVFLTFVTMSFHP
jgi:YwiC-like protein